MPAQSQETQKRPQDPIIIMDIGCRWGFAERFLSSNYHEQFRIYGFDPDKEECARLAERYQHLPNQFVHCVPVALSKRGGARNLYLTKEPACSSLHPPIQYIADSYPALQCIRFQNIVTVDTVSLGDWAKKNNVPSMDYIKIDTQGSELEILMGAEEYLETTRCLDIEVEFNPLYEGQSLFGETDTYLRSKGFALWRLSNLVHYSVCSELTDLNDVNFVHFDDRPQKTHAYGGQLFWADARYIKSDVLRKDMTLDTQQRDRDLILFETLGMRDVLQHIEMVWK